MLGAKTEIATPAGWFPIKQIDLIPIWLWPSIDGPPREDRVGVLRHIRPLLRLEARSSAVLETTEDHNLRVVSQMTGDQVMSHAEIAGRMLASSSYRRKSIYSFPEVVPDKPDRDTLPFFYRNDAARKIAAALPYLSTVNPVSMQLKMPTRLSSYAERRGMLKLFSGLGLRCTVGGLTDNPFLRVDMCPGTSMACPDSVLAKYASKLLRDVFSLLFELGVGDDLGREQIGWWHMMSAYLGLRARASGTGLELLRHRRHSLRCPDGGRLGRRACYEVVVDGLPMLMTRIAGSAPVMVPVR